VICYYCGEWCWRCRKNEKGEPSKTYASTNSKTVYYEHPYVFLVCGLFEGVFNNVYILRYTIYVSRCRRMKGKIEDQESPQCLGYYCCPCCGWYTIPVFEDEADVQHYRTNCVHCNNIVKVLAVRTHKTNRFGARIIKVEVQKQ